MLLFSWVSTQAQIDNALRAGAVGVVPKTVDGSALVAAIEAAASGQTLDVAFLAGRPPAAAWLGESEGLTPREAEVVSLIITGIGNREIASTIYLSINSVKTYIRSAYRKMGVTSRPQAILWGLRHGVEPPGRSVLGRPGRRQDGGQS